MKYTKHDINSHAELVNNCILSCETPDQLEIAEDMIKHYIVERFTGVLNPIELNMYEDYLMAAIETQKGTIMINDYPTIERNLNWFY